MKANNTPEEIEVIKSQLPDQWKYLADVSPDEEWVKSTFIFDNEYKLSLEGILGYIDQREWFHHIGF